MLVCMYMYIVREYIVSELTIIHWTNNRASEFCKSSTYYVWLLVDTFYKLYLLFSLDSQVSECACFRDLCLPFTFVLIFQRTRVHSCCFDQLSKTCSSLWLCSCFNMERTEVLAYLTTKRTVLWMLAEDLC